MVKIPGDDTNASAAENDLAGQGLQQQVSLVAGVAMRVPIWKTLDVGCQHRHIAHCMKGCLNAAGMEAVMQPLKLQRPAGHITCGQDATPSASAERARSKWGRSANGDPKVTILL